MESIDKLSKEMNVKNAEIEEARTAAEELTGAITELITKATGVLNKLNDAAHPEQEDESPEDKTIEEETGKPAEEVQETETKQEVIE